MHRKGKIFKIKICQEKSIKTRKLIQADNFRGLVST